MAKKRNAQDSTMRNVRAAQREIRRLTLAQRQQRKLMNALARAQLTIFRRLDFLETKS
jgi:hypothetical protein